MGLTRAVLSDPTLGQPLMATEITNGLILELNKVASHHEIFSLLDVLCPGGVNHECLNYKLKKIYTKEKKYFRVGGISV